MLRSALVTLVVAALPAAALAVDAPAAAPKKERKICRLGDETGSRVRPPRVCHTGAEWRAIDSQARNGNGEGNGSPFLSEKVDHPLPDNSGGPPRA
ncbi:MAG: hypothetical protein QOC98_3311 [Frankiaceae bacterium]|jgi:hypothetical protein|nr:hypothetical protein [Frankiaceae bacterium]